MYIFEQKTYVFDSVLFPDSNDIFRSDIGHL